MSLDCSKLTTGLIGAECGTTVTAGLEDDVILMNFNEVDKAASTITDNVISEIVMRKSGDTSYKGFVFTSFGRSYDDSGATFTRGTYRNTFVHTLMMRIFTKNEASKKFVNELAEGARLIAIVKNKEAGPAGEVKYEAYGWDNGMTLAELAYTAQMADGVVYPLNVGSEDGAQEGSLPKSVFDTDLTTTEQMLASITA